MVIVYDYDTVTILCIIIPHVNSPYKTSIDEWLIFYNITRCYSDGKYCQVFAIAAVDIIKYQGGHMMRNADARTIHSRQETFNSNGGHGAWFGDFKLQITLLFMVRNIKLGRVEHVETKFEQIRRNFLFCIKSASCTVSRLKITLLNWY